MDKTWFLKMILSDKTRKDREVLTFFIVIIQKNPICLSVHSNIIPLQWAVSGVSAVSSVRSSGAQSKRGYYKGYVTWE